MFASLGDGEGQFALEQRSADEASPTLGANGMDRMDVRIARAEGDDSVGPTTSCPDQPVAVRRIVGDDRNSLAFQPFENLRLGVGNRFFRAEDSRCGPGRLR